MMFLNFLCQKLESVGPSKVVLAMSHLQGQNQFMSFLLELQTKVREDSQIIFS